MVAEDHSGPYNLLGPAALLMDKRWSWSEGLRVMVLHWLLDHLEERGLGVVRSKSLFWKLSRPTETYILGWNVLTNSTINSNVNIAMVRSSGLEIKDREGIEADI